MKKFLITALLLATPLVAMAQGTESQTTPDTGSRGSNSHHARHHRRRAKNSHRHANHHKASKQHSQTH